MTNFCLRIGKILFFLAVTSSPGRAAEAEPVKNLVHNGSFESSIVRENLWDGVDAAGNLGGERGTVPVLSAAGSITSSPMPISVSVADMNSDGLLDIVTMDVLSYVRIFFNSGTLQEPAFTIGELAGIFLSRTARNDPIVEGASDAADQARRATRVSACDFRRSGKNDLVVGNYIGEMLLIPNEGSGRVPAFKQPEDIEKALLPTTKEPQRKWGNLFAPAAWDWNRDGKMDLLLGEGSYSANNIHLLINQGSPAKAVFDENNHYILAYGDGLEQLTPTVVDFNGDGFPDLLVSERSGKIACYLNTGETAKPGEPPAELRFASFLSLAGANAAPLSVGGIPTVSTGDLDGDGLFDLVIGKPNGKISFAKNIGTKTEPSFNAPVDLKGLAGTPPFALPSGWDVDYGLGRGNFFGFVSVVPEEPESKNLPAEGKSMLKIGNERPPNKVLAPPSVYSGPLAGWRSGAIELLGNSSEIDYSAPARFYRLRQSGRARLKVGATYTLSFKVKGRFLDAKAFVAWSASKTLGESRVTKGDRDSANVRHNRVWEQGHAEVSFSGGTAWTEVKREFTVVLKRAELADVKELGSTALDISFSLPPGENVYLDDVKLVERK